VPYCAKDTAAILEPGQASTSGVSSAADPQARSPLSPPRRQPGAPSQSAETLILRTLTGFRAISSTTAGRVCSASCLPTAPATAGRQLLSAKPGEVQPGEARRMSRRSPW
jgi:hypothetical protein